METVLAAGLVRVTIGFANILQYFFIFLGGGAARSTPSHNRPCGGYHLFIIAVPSHSTTTLTSAATGTLKQAAVNMKKTRMFGGVLALGTAILIINYLVDMELANFDFLGAVSQGPRHRLPSLTNRKPRTSWSPSFLWDVDALVSQFLEPGICEAADPSPVDPGNQSEKAGERRIPCQKRRVCQTPLAPELVERQVGFCKCLNFLFIIFINILGKVIVKIRRHLKPNTFQSCH